jgi:hypothetical protein
MSKIVDITIILIPFEEGSFGVASVQGRQPLV